MTTPTPEENGSAGKGIAPSSAGSDPNQSTVDPPKKKRTLLKVPSRSPSQQKQAASSDSTDLTGATASDERRGSSRGSITGRRRAGSKASSHPSQTPVTETSTTKAASGQDPPSSPQPTKEKRKSRRGFLSILNCCSPPDNAQSVEPDDLPARKSNKLKSAKEPSQPVVSDKKEAVAGQSSTGQTSKNPFEEKSTQPPAPAAGMSGPQEQSPENVAKEEIEPMAAVPATSIVPSQQTPPSTSEEKAPPPAPEIVETNNIPTALPEDAEAVITDRTLEQEQRDADIEMADAPPPEPTSAEQAQAESSPPRVELPPPPPIEQRQVQVATQQQPEAPAVPDQKQHYLLPPTRPEFHGKKCLVLDLDETLVHASFKVTFFFHLMHD